MLNAAILRINASLDLNTVLNEVVDSAGALTGSRYGMIATVDDAGGLQEFLTSGLAPDEQRQIADWPYGYQFFEHLRDLPGSAESGGLGRLHPVARLCRGPHAVRDPAGNADAPSGHACGQLLSRVDRARNTFLSGGGRHSVLIDLPPDLPHVMADRRRIVQVLQRSPHAATRRIAIP